MGVRTRADELLEDARAKIEEALKAVNEACCEIVIKADCWGADEVSEATKANLEAYRGQLLEMKQTL